MCAGLKRSMPCDNLNELSVAPPSSSASMSCAAAGATRFLGSVAVCDFKRQRTSISSVSVASSDDETASSSSSSSSAAIDSFCDSSSSSSSNSPATAALEEALALSSCDLDMPELMLDSAVHVFFDFSFPEDDDCFESSSSLRNNNVVDDMTRAMVRMTTVSNQA